MIPYGKDNWRAAADATRGRWFAARGYALCRLDVRGTGSSGGVALDEYTADETRDGFDAVEWLAAQPWCDGNVGDVGISYGGFTAIQVAMLRPPHLKAIVPVMATDDRYLDDVHYRGGCVTVSELSQYAVSQVAMNAMPPDARSAGPGWRDEWLARLEATPPWLFAWLRAPDRRPVLAAGLARARLRRDRRPRSSTSAAGTTRTSTRRSGCRRAARRRRTRWSATGSTRGRTTRHAGPEPRRAARDRPVLRPPPARRRQRLGRRAGRSSGSSTSTRRPSRSRRRCPGRWRAADGVPASVHDDRGRGASATGGWRRATAPPLPPAWTRSGTGRRPGRAAPLSWGAGGAPNGLARDLRPDETAGPTYTSEPGGAARRPGRPRGRRPRRGRRAGRDALRQAVRRRTRREIEAFGAELVDRFGTLPDEVEYLLQVVAIKSLCRRANVERIEVGPKGAVLAFRDNTFANPKG